MGPKASTDNDQSIFYAKMNPDEWEVLIKWSKSRGLDSQGLIDARELGVKLLAKSLTDPEFSLAESILNVEPGKKVY